MPAQVAVTRCPDYDPTALKHALADALNLIGSLGSVVKPSHRVLLKINHLGSHHRIDSAINTHPEFLRVVVELVREITPDVVVADGLDVRGFDGFTSSGTLEICRQLDVELLNFRGAGYREVTCSDFETIDRVPMACAALDADVVITLPKLKTHMLCLMTNAVKNNYGFVPLRLRVNYHRQFADPDVFSNLVVDLFRARVPELAIVDAVDALEGTGPSRGGVPKRLGLVLAGRDCLAVDAVSAAIMGLEPAEVATNAHAARRGLGEADLAKIDVLGERIEDVRSPFRLPASRLLVQGVLRRLPAWVMRFFGAFSGSMREFPRVVRDHCIGCGLCVRHCPEDAVTLVDGKAVIDRERCIACFCCQEFCESDAIGVRRRLLGRILSLTSRVLRSARRLIRRKPVTQDGCRRED